MVQIIYKGVSLDLDTGFILTMSKSTPFFTEQISSGEYSYPGKLPWTERNKAAIGNLHDIASVDFPEYIEVDLLANGRTKRCVLYINDITYHKTHRLGYINFSLSGVERSLYEIIRSKSIRDFKYEGDILIPNNIIYYDEGTFNYPEEPPAIDWVTEFTLDPPPNAGYCFPMALKDGFIDDSEDNYNSNLYDPAVDGLSIVNMWLAPIPTQLTGGYYPAFFPNGNDNGLAKETNWNKIVPYFYLWYVLDYIFAESGFRATIDIEASYLEDFKKIIIDSNHAINQWVHDNNDLPPHGDALNQFLSVGKDLNYRIIPNRCLPDINAVDFLNGVAEGLGLAYIFTSAVTVTITQKTVQRLVKNHIEFDQHPVIVRKKSSEYGQPSNVAFADGDGYLQDHNLNTDEYAPQKIKYDADRFDDLYPVFDDAMKDDIAWVKNTNKFYRLGEDGFWKLIEGMQNFVPHWVGDYETKELFYAPIAISENVNIAYLGDAVINESGQYIPQSYGMYEDKIWLPMQQQPGNYVGCVIKNWILESDTYVPITGEYTSKGSDFVPTDLQLMFYHGLVYDQTNTWQYPYASSIGYRKVSDDSTDRLTWMDMALFGSDSLYEKVLRFTIDRIASNEIIKFTIYGSFDRIEELDFSEIQLFNHQAFMILTMEYKAPHSGSADIEMLKLN